MLTSTQPASAGDAAVLARLGYTTGWKLVMSKPGQEERAQAELARQDFRCFLPRVRIERPGAQGMQRRVEPMFPRYLMVRLDQASADRFAAIRSTRGVTGLVRFGERLAHVPDAVVDDLARLVDPVEAILARPTQALSRGQRVRIASGVFAGLEGLLDEVDGEKRSAVLLRFLGQVNRVWMPNKDLRPILA